MIRSIRGLALGLSVVGASALPAGCSNDENTTEARIATDAVGIDPNEGTKQVTESSREVDVIKTTKVVDPKTGEVFKDQTTVTPVIVEDETTVRKDVNVNVGDTKVADPKAEP